MILKSAIKACNCLLTLTSDFPQIKIPLQEGKRSQFGFKSGIMSEEEVAKAVRIKASNHFGWFNEWNEF
ncbi:MAG: hypothetical protein ACQJCO_00705 [cyanobacterium endosymbiont of Rhopalodia sterrenbergii]